MAFDFDAAVTAPFRMQPGLRRLQPGTHQLTPAAAAHRDLDRHLNEKLAVLSVFSDQALLAEPGFDATPALQALSALAAREHPQAWRDDPMAEGAAPRWTAPALGWGLTANGEPVALSQPWPAIGPLLARLAPEWRLPALLSLGFAEDFAIVDADQGTLPWLAVALPSMWAPEHKVGRTFAQAHAPVADNRLILAATDRLLALVTGGQAWERFVWTLTHHRRLHAHPDRVDPQRWSPGLSGQALIEQTWMRTERQTFIPVPGRPQAVFTIAVDTQPLRQAIAGPGRAAQLQAALASMSPAVVAYRGLSRVHAALCAALGQLSGMGRAASGHRTLG